MPATMLGAPNRRAHHPSFMEEGLRKIFADFYPRYDSGALEEIYNVTGSEKQQETDVIHSDLGTALPKSEGASVTFDAMQEVYSKVFTHVTYALGVEFTEEAIEDNLYLSLMKRAGRALARAMAYTRQVQAFDIFNDLTKNVYAANGTDYQLLETAHFLLYGGTWANRPDTATGLSQEALEERLQAWTIGMLDHRGLKMDTRPAVLMVGASDEMLAHRILNSNLRAQSADNDTNPVKDLRNLRLFVNPHLTDDGRWFLIGPKSDVALTQFDRVKYQIKKYDSGDSGNMKARARMRISHGAAHVYGIMGSPGS
jgi:hypothetical protein